MITTFLLYILNLYIFKILTFHLLICFQPNYVIMFTVHELIGVTFTITTFFLAKILSCDLLTGPRLNELNSFV